MIEERQGSQRQYWSVQCSRECGSCPASVNREDGEAPGHESGNQADGSALSHETVYRAAHVSLILWIWIETQLASEWDKATATVVAVMAEEWWMVRRRRCILVV